MKIATHPINPMPLTLHFDNASDLSVPEQQVFYQWAALALRSCPESELCIRIVSNDESAQLNQQYRGKTGTTNVLSFPAELPSDIPSALLGDLAICAQVVLDEAQEQGKTANDHWAHMVIHGCLHLIGYDHQKTQQALKMEQLETQLLAELNIANPYKEQPTNDAVQGI